VADHATGRKTIPGNLLLALLVGLPAFSYPLSWLPKSWAHFRYDCMVPMPEIVLAAGLLASVGWLLRGRARADTGKETGSIFLPRIVILPLLAVVVERGYVHSVQ